MSSSEWESENTVMQCDELITLIEYGLFKAENNFSRLSYPENMLLLLMAVQACPTGRYVLRNTNL